MNGCGSSAHAKGAIVSGSTASRRPPPGGQAQLTEFLQGQPPGAPGGEEPLFEGEAGQRAEDVEIRSEEHASQDGEPLGTGRLLRRRLPRCTIISQKVLAVSASVGGMRPRWSQVRPNACWTALWAT